MDVARVRGGVVVNIEVADAAWMRADRATDTDTMVAYTDAAPAHIGLGYDPQKGFQQPDWEEHDDAGNLIATHPGGWAKPSASQLMEGTKDA